MTFPRFKLNTTEEGSPEVRANRERYARFIAGRKSLHEFAGGIAPGSVHYVNPLDLNSPTDAARSAEEAAEAFGLELFRRCGKNWPTMIALASGAAMRAERDATGEVK